MIIETLEDVLNQYADWLGVYGCCQSAERNEDCDNTNPHCCRVGFMMEQENRILRAVANQVKLGEVGFSV